MRKIYLFDLGLLVVAGTIAAALTAKPVHSGASSETELAGEVLSCQETPELIESGCEMPRNASKVDGTGPE